MEKEINFIYLTGTYFQVNREQQRLEEFGNRDNAIPFSKMERIFGAYCFDYDPETKNIRAEKDHGIFDPGTWISIPEVAFSAPFSVHAAELSDFARKVYRENFPETDLGDHKLQFILDPRFSGTDGHLLPGNQLPKVQIGASDFEVDNLNHLFNPVDRLTPPISFYDFQGQGKSGTGTTLYDIFSRQAVKLNSSQITEWPNTLFQLKVDFTALQTHVRFLKFLGHKDNVRISNQPISLLEVSGHYKEIIKKNRQRQGLPAIGTESNIEAILKERLDITRKVGASGAKTPYRLPGQSKRKKKSNPKKP